MAETKDVDVEQEEVQRVPSSPARRFHKLLQDPRRVEKKHKEPARKIIAEAFGHSAENYRRVYKSTIAFLDLIEQTQSALKKSQLPTSKVCLSGVARIANVFQKLNVDVKWESYNSQISDGDMDLLALATQTLEGEGYEQLITPEEIAEIEEEKGAVLKTLHESDAPQEVKEVIKEMIGDVEEGLRDYKVTGVDGLKKALGSAYGKIYLEQKALQECEDQRVLQKAYAWLERVNTLAATVGYGFAGGKLLEAMMGKLPL